jgi:hypothetical protein
MLGGRRSGGSTIGGAWMRAWELQIPAILERSYTSRDKQERPIWDHILAGVK